MTFGRRFASIIGGLAVMFFMTGCELLPNWFPFQGKTTDSIPGLVTPAQKMAQLKKLRLDASETGPEFKQQVVEYLTGWLAQDEQDPLIRSEIIKTLGEYPLPSVAPVLKVALTDNDPDVRIAACNAFAKVPNADMADLMVDLLQKDANQDVRLAAARGLGQSKDQRAITALGEALADSDPAMQHRAVLSLQTITQKDLGNSVERWQQYVQNENPKPAAEPVSIADKLKKTF
jgi:HEAT repeat protein